MGVFTYRVGVVKKFRARKRTHIFLSTSNSAPPILKSCLRPCKDNRENYKTWGLCSGIRLHTEDGNTGMGIRLDTEDVVKYWRIIICTGILARMWPCGMMTFLCELFISESKSQVYRHLLHNFLQIKSASNSFTS